MRVVLLALSGDLGRWQEKLIELYPNCSIDLISRAEFENGSHIKRLKALRAKPNGQTGKSLPCIC